jgi:perosamine synthetase
MQTVRIPLSAPDIDEDDIAAVAAVLRTPQLSLGPQLTAFEQEFAAYIGTQHAVAVNSGTSGLQLCLRAIGIQPGDEVLLPAFTFIAVANVVRLEQAVPVFVDVDADSLNMDPDRARAAITPKTRAMMIVHTFGRPAALDRLMAVAEDHGLRVIEDACEAIGADFKGRRVGSFGDAGAFAFYPNKQITTGEGGMIVTNDITIARRVRSLRNQGRTDSGDWLDHAEPGFNYRLSEINCALGRSQLRRIEAILAKRARVAAWYDGCLREEPTVIVPELRIPEGRVSWFVYVIRLSDAFKREERDRVVERMMLRGIACGRYFPPIHQQPAYSGWSLRHPLPVTESVGERCIALPFFNQLTKAQVQEVSETLLTVIQALRNE